ncbi:hypothetical protein ACJMK2_023923 [Sinanodonta woodiana]|uniref:Uncharacterized protein n=1 Tax=Sinanodonta woodiana TaxID=1069815 RepID=A0ABD3T7G6_SINWO
MEGYMSEMVLKLGYGNVARIGHGDQAKLLKEKEEECMVNMANDPQTITGLYCNRTWDNLSCWPDTPAGTTAVLPCPLYINGFDKEENATRHCLSNGTWYVSPLYPNQMQGWTDYAACLNNSVPVNENFGVPGNFQDNINKLSLMYNIGYSLSLVSLVIAMAIMLYFRRLRCNRNIIHVHLFMSFILRAVISLVRDSRMVQGLGFPGDIAYEENGNIYFLKEGSHWQCRMFFTIFHYSLSANYIWIFIEGLYLHMLINVSVFSEKHRIIWYIVGGWGIPWLFVTPWVCARYFLDNTLCWNTHPREDLHWILKGPITATIVINFIFYVNIIRVLFTKVTATPCPEAKIYRYRRLAKSVLILIPAFGAYYIVFVCITYPTPRLDDTTEIGLLYAEMFFNSYGGFIIALLFCFFNSEVQYEIRKTWYRHSLRRGSGSKNFSNFSNQGKRGYSVRPNQNGVRGSELCARHSMVNNGEEDRNGSVQEDIALLHANVEDSDKQDISKISEKNLSDTSNHCTSGNSAPTCTIDSSSFPNEESQSKEESSFARDSSPNRPEMNGCVIAVQIEKSIQYSKCQAQNKYILCNDERIEMKNGYTDIDERIELKNGYTDINERIELKNGYTDIDERIELKNGYTDINERTELKNGYTDIDERIELKNDYTDIDERTELKNDYKDIDDFIYIDDDMQQTDL